MSKLTLALVVVAMLAVGGYGGYRYAHHRLMSASATPDTSGKPVLYWYDPMYPQQKFDKPGKSPFMDMQLVPKYAGEEADSGTVSISPRVVQNLGVRVAEAKSGALEQRLQAVGAVAYNERNVVQLQSRAMGFVEKLHARAPLDPVKKGAPLVDILYPEWAGAQEEFLLLKKSGSAELAQAARQRLVLLGMSEEQIAAVEREGKVRNRFTLASPLSGVIAELGVREGMSAAPGMTLFRLVDLSTVWVNAEVPEAQAAQVRPGTPVKARVAAYPGELFEGRVGAILPEVNAATRTLRARVELRNREARLKPGMYATLEFAAPGRKEVVLVPSEAVIRTGTRDVVVVALGGGKFRAAEVEVGAEAAGKSEIRKGLAPGDKVVLSGQFLIDSEASLSATVARLEGTEAPSGEAAHKGRGTITDIDARQGRVELDHEPIPSMQWPRMKMGFLVEDRNQLARLKKGDRVEFELRAKPDDEGNYVISRIQAGK
jgi:Cu(I)/Ag(I) efflux system membrane fusion protein